MKKLLIPIDGSENSNKALLEGKKLAEVFESEIIILYVGRLDRLPGAYADVTPLDLAEMDDIKANKERVGREVINAGLEVMKNYSGTVKSDIEFGDPAEVIIEVGEKENVDLIIMGSRGLSGVSRFAMGSVSDKVLNHAHSSVLIVR